MFLRSFLAALVVAAMAAGAQGADSDAARCGTSAPWILEGTEQAGASSLSSGGTDTPNLDVVTYNLHSGLGSDHASFFRRRATVERNLREIASSIAAAAAGGPDIVALNEVDFASRRSGWIDQARFVADELARLTGSIYEVVRGETWRRDVPGFEVRFGNAALVRLPVVDAKACLFSNLDQCGLASAEPEPEDGPRGNFFARMLSEPRGVIRVVAELQRRTVEVLVTHLDAFDMRAREAQAKALRSRFLTPGQTTVLLGDMNAVPVPLTRERWMFSEDRTHAILATGHLADACISFASRLRQPSLAPWATFPAEAPVWGLDWVLASLDLEPQTVAAIGATASDHRGLHVRYRRLLRDAEIDASRLRHGRVCERLQTYDPTCPAGNG